MICSHFFLRRRHNHRAALSSHHYFIFSLFKVFHSNHSFADSGRHKCRFIDQISKVSARHPRGSSSYNSQINIRAYFYFLTMNFKNFLTTLYVRHRYLHFPIKPTWSQQCWVKNISSICGCYNYHTIIFFKTIHLY